MTQQEVANKLGISIGRYGQWEAFYAEPDSEFIVKIAQLFMISCDQLLGNAHIDFNYTGAQI